MYPGPNGVQRQVKYNEVITEDKKTIQGNIELALRGLKPENEVLCSVSSRTDAGVHALHNTMQVDLMRANGEPYPTLAISLYLNKYFLKEQLPIRVISTYQVPNTFNCRYAESRTYLYRLVIIKYHEKRGNTLMSHIPIEEYDRALFKCTSTFDVSKAREAAACFLGVHDFRTFMGRGSRAPEKITRREVSRLEIEEGNLNGFSPFSWPQSDLLPVKPDDYKLYNIYMESRGFLYNQVS